MPVTRFQTANSLDAQAVLWNHAVEHGSVGDLEALQIKYGLECLDHVSRDFPRTLLARAVQLRLTGTTLWLLMRGANPDGRTYTSSLGVSQHTNPLHEAIQGWAGHLAVLLLSEGADIDWMDARGYKALHHAVWANTATLQTVLGLPGVDPDDCDGTNTTPIMMAATGLMDPEQSKAAFHALTAAGAKDWCHTGGSEGFDAAMIAALCGNAPFLELLLGAHKFDTTQKSKEGKTAMDYAVARGHSDVIAILKRYGWT